MFILFTSKYSSQFSLLTIKKYYMKIIEKLIDLTRDVYHNNVYFRYIGKTDLIILDQIL